MKTILLGLTLLTSMSSMASTYKITSSYEEEDQYIKVVEKNDSISFYFCDYYRCEVMGPRDSYPKSKLLSKKRKEYLKTVGAVVGDLGIGIAAFAGSRYLAATYLAANMGINGMGITMIAGGASGASVSQILSLSTAALNPKNHYDSGKNLEKALSQKHFEEQDILEFKNNLEELLFEILD